MMSPIALIGFGEVGQALARDLAPRAEVRVWDIGFTDPTSRPARADLAAMLDAINKDLDR